MPNLPQLLRAARSEAGLKQADAARRCGVSRRMFQRYEAGESFPPVHTAGAVARFCGISTRELEALRTQREAERTSP